MIALLFIIIAIIVIVAIIAAAMYNGLVRLNVRSDEAWSDITVQLKRRADLIPNLVSTVQGYATHEKSILKTSPKPARQCSAPRARPTPPKPTTSFSKP